MRHTAWRERLIALVAAFATGLALLFDVLDLPICPELTVPAAEAAAGERRETEQPNETH
jgi:hypothetical protein